MITENVENQTKLQTSIILDALFFGYFVEVIAADEYQCNQHSQKQIVSSTIDK